MSTVCFIVQGSQIPTRKLENYPKSHVFTLELRRTAYSMFDINLDRVLHKKLLIC